MQAAGLRGSGLHYPLAGRSAGSLRRGKKDNATTTVWGSLLGSARAYFTTYYLRQHPGSGIRDNHAHQAHLARPAADWPRPRLRVRSEAGRAPTFAPRLSRVSHHARDYYEEEPARSASTPPPRLARRASREIRAWTLVDPKWKDDRSLWVPFHLTHLPEAHQQLCQNSGRPSRTSS